MSTEKSKALTRRRSMEEVNFVRLLDRCKRVVAEGTTPPYRLSSFVTCVRQLLEKLLVMQEGQCEAERVSQYRRDVEFLAGLADAAQRESAVDRANAVAAIPAPSWTNIGDDDTQMSLLEDSVLRKRQTEASSSAPLSLASIKATSAGRYKSDLRQLLLGRQDDSEIKLRQGGDVDEVMKHHDELQSEMAEEFLRLTVELRENVQSAGDIVRSDTATVGRASTAASANDETLRREAQRLSKLVASYWDCVVWLLLLAVSLSFIGMVLFMRLFPKPI